jgi:hypothetical protein
MTPQQAAQTYIDHVLKSQRDRGDGGNVSPEDYQRAVAQAAQALADLAEVAAESAEPVPA